MALPPVEGFQSKRVRVALDRSLELCRQIGPHPQLMPIYAGLAAYALTSSEVSLKTALEWANELKSIANQQDDLAHLANADTILISVHFALGHINKVVELGRLALSYNRFDQANHENMIHHYTHDQRVILAPLLAGALYSKGKLKEAKALMAKEPLPNFKHTTSRAVFLGVSILSYKSMHDLASSKAMTEELLKLAHEYGYFFWRIWGLVFHGWTIAQLGEIDAGIAEMRQGVSMARMAGGLLVGSHLLIMLVEGLCLKDEYKEALKLLEEAFEYCKKKDESHKLSTLNRLKGECLQKLSEEEAEIEKYFEKAIALAKEQDTPMFELQAALSLAKYWQTNKKEEAHFLLTELLERITPIIDTDVIPEYIEAKEILTKLI